MTDRAVVVAITGSRTASPTRRELAAFLDYLRAGRAETLRHGDGEGTDRTVAQAVIAAPDLTVRVSAWPATDVKVEARRDAAMLLGDRSDPAVLGHETSEVPRPRANVLVAWPSGADGTASIEAAWRLSIPVIPIERIVSVYSRPLRARLRR